MAGLAVFGIMLAGMAALVGAVGAFLAVAALRQTGPMQRGPAAWFWGVLGLYMACFAVVRLNHVIGLPSLAWHHLATTFGAASVVFLTYILIGTIWGRTPAWIGAGIAAAAAAVILGFVFGVGSDVRAGIGLQIVPSSRFARLAIAAVYLVLPVAMAATATYVTRHADALLRRRSTLFAAGAMLVYLPNAVRYVTFVPDVVSVTFAFIMAAGPWLGWKSARSV